MTKSLLAQALIAQLGGGFFAGGGAQIAPIFPNTDLEAWQLPANGHVDGASAGSVQPACFCGSYVLIFPLAAKL